MMTYLQPQGRIRAILPVCVMLLMGSLASPVHGESFPPLKLQPLAGNRALQLPLRKAGHRVLIALGFEPKDQPLLEAGMRQAQPLKLSLPFLSIIEIPVIELKYLPYRPAVQGFMKQQVRHKPYLEQVYPLYSDQGRLKAQLKLPANTRIAFLLCDETGRALWKTAHLLTAEDVLSLKTLLTP